MQARLLKLGFFIQPVHPPFRPYGDVLRADRNAVVNADHLGYHEAFIGEHLMDSAETITSSLAFIGKLAETCPIQRQSRWDNSDNQPETL